MENEQKTMGKKLGESLRSAFRLRRTESGALAQDILTVAASFLFSRTHLFFGARPFGIAFAAAMPKRAILAAVGAVFGALSLGKEGIVFAMVTTVTTLLRVIISGSGKEEKTLFSEAVPLRVSAAVIGGFIAGLYQVLLNGFGTSAVLFGGVMMGAAGVVTFVFCGLFATKVPVTTFLCGGRDILVCPPGDKQGKAKLVFFEISVLLCTALLAYSLSPYSFLGISFAYLFIGAATVFSAKRFGPLRAMAVGFFSAILLSGTDAVGFAIAGLSAGLLFRIGIGYAVAGSIAAVAAWSGYNGGVEGFLSVMPEFSVSALLAAPFLKSLTPENPPVREKIEGKAASDMVGTMTLAYREREGGAAEALAHAVAGLSPMILKLSETDAEAAKRELREKIAADADLCCRACGDGCRPSSDALIALAEKIYENEKITEADLGLPEGCPGADGLLRALRRDTVRTLPAGNAPTDAAFFDLFAKLLAEARAADAKEKAPAAVSAEKVSAVFEKGGFPDGIVKVFGERRKFLICAGEDSDGRAITDPALLTELGDAVGAKFGTPEYYRRGKYVLMQAAAEPRFCAESVTVSTPRGGEVSGDSTAVFESRDKHFLSVLSDGMGSGEEAKRTSGFVTEFLKKMSGSGADFGTLLYLLNGIIRRRGAECLATVDLFDLDLYSGDAAFYKSGAAPSYVCRGSSVFRIRSETVPIGLLEKVDAERIKVDVKPGDLIVMLSDGVGQAPEDTPWLLELLAATDGSDKNAVKKLADRILNEARTRAAHSDDVTVTVTRIFAA